ncbi:MAG: hypothetical protein N2439_03150, partial [Anaerolineae bacterium]|nr:hypothetical protein [Anaerolineae bacterium]
AASAGGMVLYSQGTAAAEAQARYYASLHGYSGSQVEITWPSQCIRVTITRQVRPIFAAMVWNGTFTVRGRAAACYRITQVGASVVVLDPNACSALNVSGSGTITVRRGNITVNSTCNPSISVGGGASITTETPIVYVGGVSGASAITPPPVRGSPLPDPLASLPVPDACNSCASSPTQSCTKTSCAPGCYKNGLSLSGGTLTMASGVYCIAGSGMKITGGTNLSGSGVVLYFMQGGFDISGNGTLNLTPPASGTYQGILIFQARNNTSSSKISGQAALSGIHGVIYMPVGALELAGGASVDANFAVSTLKVTGGGGMVIEGYTGAGANWSTIFDALME